MRLIDADALIKWINESRCADCPDKQEDRCAACQWDDVIMSVETAPTVALSENSITLEWTPDADNLSKEVAERALDEFEYNGRTIREWVEAIMTLPEPPEEVSGDGQG